MRICLFEDRRVVDLAPLTLTRPVYDLTCGLTSLAEQSARYFGADAVGYLVRPLVQDLAREQRPHAPVNDPLWLRAGPTVLINARWIPPVRAAGTLIPTTAQLLADGPFLALCDGELAYAALTPELLAAVSPATLDDCLEDWLSAMPRHEIGGSILRRPWDLLDRIGSSIEADFDQMVDPDWPGSRPDRVAVVGPADLLHLDPSAVVEPMTVFDTTRGPIIVAEGARIQAFCRVEGPCAIGAGTHLLAGAHVRGSAIGPVCRIGGEVEASLILGYSNKAHDGFLGHSVIGEWVNLAAGTQTGDLRNDYAAITVPVDGARLATGRQKLGSVIGDHTKTGLNVLLNCGSVIGAFASLLPCNGLTPREVPSFSRSGVEGLTEDLDLNSLFATADAMMRRRGRALTRAEEAVYRAVAAQTAASRRRLLGLPGTEPRIRKLA